MRYKFDALEYYQTDIDWFAFNFVILCIHFGFTRFLILVHRGEYKLMDKKGEDTNKIVNFDNYGWSQVYMMITMIVIRVLCLLIMGQVRT